MQQAYININGKILQPENAAVPADDRSFRYGYGLFETMLVLDGGIRHEELHWERLSSGLRTLRIPAPPRFLETLQLETGRTIAKLGASGALRVRLQVTAGSGGYFEPGDPKPFFIIECRPLPGFSPALNENGLVLGIAEARKEPGPYSACKTSSALCYAMAAREAEASGWDDALLCNSAGNIVESSISNVFMQYRGRILTPPLADGCVDGVMRRVLLQRFAGAGIPVAETSVSTEMLQGVEGLFLTNSLRGIRWVKAVEGLRLTLDFALKALPLLA